MIVVDTGGIVALLDRDDRHHEVVRRFYDEQGDRWILPWAILPEVDYLAAKYLGRDVADAFAQDLSTGLFLVDSNATPDLTRAGTLLEKYRDLQLGLVDAVVMAQAERHRARVIVTTDARHFRAVALAVKPKPRLVPLDE